MKSIVIRGIRISYHAVYDNSIPEALEYAKENGFKGIQAGIETPHLSFERLCDKDMDKIIDFQENYGLYLTLHAPDEITSLFAFNRSIRDGIFNYYKALFGFAKREIHIHDRREASGKIASHRVVGTGRIDFLNYFNILQGADVLDYCIEVRPKEKALESLSALKKMIMYA